MHHTLKSRSFIKFDTILHKLILQHVYYAIQALCNTCFRHQVNYATCLLCNMCIMQHVYYETFDFAPCVLCNSALCTTCIVYNMHYATHELCNTVYYVICELCDTIIMEHMHYTTYKQKYLVKSYQNPYKSAHDHLSASLLYHELSSLRLDQERCVQA